MLAALAQKRVEVKLPNSSVLVFASAITNALS